MTRIVDGFQWARFFSMLNINTFKMDVILKIVINQNEYTSDNHQVQH